MHCEFDKERVGFNPPLPNNAKVLASGGKEFFFFFQWYFFFGGCFLKRVSESEKSLRHGIGFFFFFFEKILSAIGCPILYQLQTSARRRRPGCQSTPSDYR